MNSSESQNTSAVTFTRTPALDVGKIHYVTNFKRCNLDEDWGCDDIKDLAAAIAAVISEIYEDAEITVSIGLGGDAWSEVSASDVPRWAQARGSKLLVLVAAFVEDYVEQRM